MNFEVGDRVRATEDIEDLDEDGHPTITRGHHGTIMMIDGVIWPYHVEFDGFPNETFIVSAGEIEKVEPQDDY